MSALKVGSNVLCRGALAKDFSLRGTVEVIIPDGNYMGAVYKYGVRLENGNYKLFSPEAVKSCE